MFISAPEATPSDTIPPPIVAGLIDAVQILFEWRNQTPEIKAVPHVKYAINLA